MPGAKGLVLGRLCLGGGVDAVVQVRTKDTSVAEVQTQRPLGLAQVWEVGSNRRGMHHCRLYQGLCEPGGGWSLGLVGEYG